MQGVNEMVHLVDGNETTSVKLAGAGFKVENMDEEAALKKFNLQALPELLVANNGTTLYQGGYGKDQQHSQVYEDVQLIQDLRIGQSVFIYPTYGCANGKLRKNRLDPLGLKYEAN